MVVCSPKVTDCTVRFCCSKAFFSSEIPVGSWLAADFSPWPVVNQTSGDVACVTLVMAEVIASSPLKALTLGSAPSDIVE